MTDKFKNVHPLVEARVNKVLQAMDRLGFPMMVTDGFRTTEQQQILYAQGRTRPGLKVTDADGVKTLSNHQAHNDGLGHAVDCCFIDENGKPSWNTRFPWETYGSCCEAVGLSWGGRFKHPPDMPHVELKES